MPCTRRSRLLLACAFCYGPPLVATALRPFWLFRGVLAAAAATSNLEGVLTTSHIHFGSSQAKTRREAISYFDLSRSKKKDDQDPTTRTEDQDRILLSPGPKQSFGGHYTGGRKLRSNPQSVPVSLDSILRQIQSLLGNFTSAR